MELEHLAQFALAVVAMTDNRKRLLLLTALTFMVMC